MVDTKEISQDVAMLLNTQILYQSPRVGDYIAIDVILHHFWAHIQ